jgi:hypothetical protein
MHNFYLNLNCRKKGSFINDLAPGRLEEVFPGQVTYSSRVAKVIAIQKSTKDPLAILCVQAKRVYLRPPDP